MAAIARSGQLAAAALICSAMLAAQQSTAIHQQIAQVAAALSSRNPEEAMEGFDKSFEGYSKIHDYFIGLTAGSTVVNELDFSDDEIENGTATLKVHWTLTIGDRSNGLTQNREEDLTIKLILKKNHWRIVDLEPIEFFNPDSTKSK